jgi:hypothetical protein
MCKKTVEQILQNTMSCEKYHWSFTRLISEIHNLLSPDNLETIYVVNLFTGELIILRMIKFDCTIRNIKERLSRWVPINEQNLVYKEKMLIESTSIENELLLLSTTKDRPLLLFTNSENLLLTNGLKLEIKNVPNEYLTISTENMTFESMVNKARSITGSCRFYHKHIKHMYLLRGWLDSYLYANYDYLFREIKCIKSNCNLHVLQLDLIKNKIIELERELLLFSRVLEMLRNKAYLLICLIIKATKEILIINK